MRASILLLVIATLSPGVAIATRRVPAEYPTIQAGIDAALSSLDTVLVAPGTYLENLVTRGIPITLVSEAGPAATIIDGSNPDDPDSASVILALSALTIEGFTITGGSGTRRAILSLSMYGGGLCVLGPATIRGNWITENHVVPIWSDGGGIGVFETNAPVRITGNRIYSNSASSSGGAMRLSVWDVRLEDNVIYDNHVTTGTGGAVYDRIFNSVQLSNIYACNTTESDEGSGGVHGCREVRNCTLVSNVGAWPALFLYGRTHNTIYAFNVGGGLSCVNSNSSCNDLYGNTPYDVYPDCLWIIGQNGNISVDPAFGDADSCAASYCLSPGSPLLPENSPPGCGLIGARGACEVLAIDALTSPDFAAGPLLARPNPLNPQTTLTFVLSESRHVEVNIVDAKGRVVRTLVSQTMPRGQHDVTWDGRDATGREVASGAYIAVLKSPSARLSQKLLLLK